MSGLYFVVSLISFFQTLRPLKCIFSRTAVDLYGHGYIYNPLY